MSSTGQIVGGVVGAVVGFFVGNPVIGAQIGITLGGLVDPPKVLGPRLDDLAQQTSTYGAFIPRIYGTAPVTGNIFWIQGNALIEHEAESEGKGGPEVTTFEYFATFAVGLCEGEIDAVRRIWVGGQLWYDAGSDDLSTIIASNQNNTFTLYTGSDTQLADPLIQADRGVANVPAYRGLAYIVFEEMALKDFGNSLAAAQVKVEVVTDGGASNHLISNFSIIGGADYGGTQRSAGNPMDENGLSNFVVPSSSYPLWVRSNGSEIVSFSRLDDGATFPTTFPVMVLGSSLHSLQYAFIASNDIVLWGKQGQLSRLQIAGSSPRILAEKDGVIFIYWSLGAAYSISSIRDGTIPEIRSTAAVSNNCLIAVDEGNSVVTCRTVSTGPMTITTRDQDMVMVSQFTVTPAANFLIGAQDNASVVSDGTLHFIGSVGSGASFVLIISIDLNSQAIVYEGTVPTNFPGVTFSLRPAVTAIGNTIFYGSRNTGSSLPAFVQAGWQIGRVSVNGVPLSSIVEAECLKSDLLTAADLDVTELTDQVRGYRVSALAPLRGGIDPLRKAWPFDAIQQGYKIKFKKRGGASVATITEGELDAREAGASPGVRIANVREMDLVLPRQLTATYLDATREYDANVAEESRE